MRKSYEEIELLIVSFTDDAVRCSNTFDVGDDTSEDIFN